MLKTAAVLVLSIPVLLVGTLLSSSCMVVDVKQADGPRLIVPVPLIFGRAALAFAPEEVAHVEVPELEEYHHVALDVTQELRHAPDGVLVEVHDRSEHVLIEKVGDELLIDVHSDDDEVSVTLPLRVVEELLESYDGRELEVGRVLEALSSLSRTDLVHVRNREEEVKVWIW